MDSLDVIIVGAGTAGLAALREVQKRTQRFVIINDGPFGTLCARAGCMPSKALIAAANAFHARHTLRDFGIAGGEDLSVDVGAVLRRVRATRDPFVAANVAITNALGERAIRGRAQLLAPDRVRVDGRELRARRIILATGSTPYVPEAFRPLGSRVLTTDTLFEQDTLPARIGVIGQGPLGVELAQALHRLGLAVVAVGEGQLVAGLTDPVVNAVAVVALEEELEVHLGDAAELSAVPDGVLVRAGTLEATVDSVLVALSRKPNVEGLGLENLGVPLDSQGLPKVDMHTMQVGALPVFLVGDALGEAMILHEATDDGHVAGLNATAETAARYRRRTALRVVFSEPNIARVGKRWSELETPQVAVGEARFETQSRARIARRNRGVVRVYADRKSGRLLGSELCVSAGEHLAHLLALAIDRELTVAQLLRMPFYHPVYEEGLRTALRRLSDELPRTPDSDLDRC